MDFKKMFSKNAKRVLFFEADLESARVLKAEIKKEEKSAILEDLFDFSISEKKHDLIAYNILDFLNQTVSEKPKSDGLFLVLGRPFLKSDSFEFVFDRENHTQPISETELETILTAAAEKMIGTELPKVRRFFAGQSTVLALSKIKEVKIDGRKVMNPLGFSGRRLRIYFENIYSEKLFWDNLEKLLKAKKCRLDSLLDRTLNMDKVFSFLNEEGALVEIKDNRAKISLLGSAGEKAGGFEWGWEKIRVEIMKNLSLSPNQAEIVRMQYATGEMSGRAGDWFDKILKEEFQVLADGFLKVLKSFGDKEIPPAIYFSGSDKMLSAAARYFEKLNWGRGVFSKKPKTLIYPKREIFDKMSIKIEDDENDIANNLSLALVLSLAGQFVSEPDYSVLDKIMKRCIRWFQ